jgi:HEAT repeat protein
MRFILTLSAILCGSPIAVTDASAQDPNGKSAAQQLDEFSKGWDESKWEKTFRTAPGGYMRPTDDPGWKVRMQTLRGVVALGKEAVPALVEALKDKDVARRVFAAQALGYLAQNVPIEPLLEAAKSDPEAAVRLYVADALGMKGGKAVDFDTLLKAETSGDVRKHLSYAKERKGEPVEPAVVKQLTDWDTKTIDSALVGQAAPDFTLQSATGATVSLRDFKGQSAVVLVFVYGDT